MSVILYSYVIRSDDKFAFASRFVRTAYVDSIFVDLSEIRDRIFLVAGHVIDFRGQAALKLKKLTTGFHEKGHSAIRMSDDDRDIDIESDVGRMRFLCEKFV